MKTSDLRAYYGSLIGQIAHSHNWNVHILTQKFASTLGAFGGMPAKWTVDAIKVALLLRCEDAAHIDHRRAPRFLLALSKPTGIAFTYWSFQTKLAKSHLNNNKLIYTSTSAFSLEQAVAWTLCWEVLRMIDRELSDSSDILTENTNGFQAIGVLGAKSVSAAKEHIRTEGWQPVSTDLHVSDVPRLAKTLGGRDLYSHEFAPIRELIQNAADTIEARAALDNHFPIELGEIIVRIVPMPASDQIKVEIDDYGIGMSEKTLTGALLDFDRSFWRSDAAREEFPGLPS